MLECNRVVKRKLTFLTRSLLILAVCVCAVFLLAQAVTVRTTYLIDDNGRILVHSTYTTDPVKILQEAGVELNEADTYTKSESADMHSITVLRCQTITVNWGSRTLVVNSYGETVQSLLSRMNLSLTGADTVSVPLSAATWDGMQIHISRMSETEQTYTETIPCETIYCYDASLPAGQTQVLTAGTDGQLLCTASVYYANGQEISRVQISQTVVRQPITRVVAIGTGKPVMVSEEADISNTPGTIRSGG